MHHLTCDLAVKLAGKHITVNAIAPGPFESKMTEWMLEKFQDRFERDCPDAANRASVLDMAGVALYLELRGRDRM